MAHKGYGSEKSGDASEKRIAPLICECVEHLCRKQWKNRAQDIACRCDDDIKGVVLQVMRDGTYDRDSGPR